MSEPRISIVIPTQRRPGGLAVAMRSALAQTGFEAGALELVVVDNDVRPSAQAQVEALAAEAPFPVIYLHEPRAGVANARNAALGLARAPLIAFLDDDEEAPAGWLAALAEAQVGFDADAVFGPVRGRLPPGVTRHRAYLEAFFSRIGPAEAGLIAHYYGCGDSLLRRASLPGGDQPFDATHNQTGGEDTLMFAAMQVAGARFAWAPEAWVWEDPAPSRLTLRYTLARAFAYGQGPSAACAAKTPPDVPGIAYWMAVGVCQALAFGMLAAVKAILRASDAADTLDRAARGLGKVLWWGPFKLKFYGAAPSGV